ncbi:MAG: zinc ribbon domain-containing protein [Ruminococcus sp.]|nr:zinc ribbon domain-containing protein [Ruminococcus sp.]
MYCKYCGQSLDEYTAFCPGCGNKTDETAGLTAETVRKGKRVISPWARVLSLLLCVLPMTAPFIPAVKISGEKDLFRVPEGRYSAVTLFRYFDKLITPLKTGKGHKNIDISQPLRILVYLAIAAFFLLALRDLWRYCECIASRRYPNETIISNTWFYSRQCSLNMLKANALFTAVIVIAYYARLSDVTVSQLVGAAPVMFIMIGLSLANVVLSVVRKLHETVALGFANKSSRKAREKRQAAERTDVSYPETDITDLPQNFDTEEKTDGSDQ